MLLSDRYVGYRIYAFESVIKLLKEPTRIPELNNVVQRAQLNAMAKNTKDRDDFLLLRSMILMLEDEPEHFFERL